MLLPPGSVVFAGRRLLAHLSISGQPGRRWLLLNATKPRQIEAKLLKRSYASKNKKTLSSINNGITSKTKTTVKTGTESMIFGKRREHEDSQAKAKENPAAESTASQDRCENPGESLPQASSTATATKTIKIETPKGLLSVTTTIEDSKINDVIFEKTKAARPSPSKASKKTEEIKTATTSMTTNEIDTTSEAITSEDKSPKTSKISSSSSAATKDHIVNSVASLNANAAVAAVKQQLESKPEAIKGAAATAAGVAKTTVASAAAAVKELLTKKDTSTTAAGTTAGDTTTATVVTTTVEVKPKPRVKVDFNRSSLERNFITPARAMSDFLLKPADLENLPKIKRRSPYEQEPPITVYWRRDVEAKAIEVWGSRENLLKEALKRELERKQHQQNIFTVKRRLRDYRREVGYRATIYDKEPGLRGKSGQVVLIAVGINSVNFLFKVCGWLYTGSHSMFAEAIHSLADTINQLILAYGIHKSTQIADSDHPYGYSNMRYVSSLISGVGIFCVGAGLSVYHGITGLINPEPMADLFWAFFILGGSLVSEGATLLVAMNELKRSAKLQGISFKEYVISGKDPCVNVVLTEDAAAVTSVGVAAACMGLSQVTGSPIFDAMGSLLVGGILGAVASFIIYTNVQALVGKSIREERLNKINSELESDIMIRAIHDVKGIDMGNSLVRYKAELDFDGRELTRSYLDKQDLNELLKVVKSFQTVEELEQFLLTHGENIVDLMGGEIDRIEMKLRKKFPEIRHCDLEIL